MEADYFKLDPILFVRPPDKEFLCPACLLVMRNPHLMSCCGSHVCQKCVEKFTSAKQSSPCCHEPSGSYTTLLDKRVKQKISELEMKCARCSEGCEWKGKSEDLVNHMNDACLYHIHPCPNNCGGLFPRSLLDTHKCCQHTVEQNIAESSMKPTGQDISSENDPKQEAVAAATVTDVNELHAKINSMQEEMMGTVETNCRDLLHQLETKLFDAFKSFQEENKSVFSAHQKMVEDRLLEIEKNSTAESKEQSAATPPLAPVQEMKWINSSWPVPLSLTPNTLLPLPPCLITMTDFETYKKEKKEWFSPPFYSGPTGYKFVIGIQACGVGTGKGSHVSLTVYLAKGEHDGQLKWPFQGSLKVSLLNWKENKTNVGCKVLFDNRAKVNGFSNRVVNEDRASKGCGFPRFVTNNDLHFNASTNIEYLRNNTLCFQVTEIVTL